MPSHPLHKFQSVIKTISSSPLFLLTQPPSIWSPYLHPIPSNPSSLYFAAKGISELKGPHPNSLDCHLKGLHGLIPNLLPNLPLLPIGHLSLQLTWIPYYSWDNPTFLPIRVYSHHFLYLGRPYSQCLHIQTFQILLKCDLQHYLYY